MRDFRYHGAKSVTGLLRRLTRASCMAAGLAASLLLPGLGAGAVQAQEVAPKPLSLDGVSDKGLVLRGIHFDEVARLAEEINFATSIIFQEGSNPTILLRDDVGSVLVAQPVNCAGTALEDRCTGLLLYYIIRGNPAWRASMMVNTNRYNSVQYYGSGHISAASNAVMIRMVLGDHGITRGQLATELFTARSAAMVFARVLGVRRRVSTPVSTPGAASVFSGPIGRSALPSGVSAEAPEAPGAFEGLMTRWRKLGLVDEILNDPN